MTGRLRIGTDRGECRRHMPVLLRAVETGLGARGAAAIAEIARTAGAAAAGHLEHCGACRSRTTEAALTLIRIQRWADEAAGQEAPPDAWLRLRSRLEASRRRARETAWRARLNVAGLITSTLLLVVIVGPTTMSGTAPGSWSPTEPSGSSTDDQFSWSIELRYVRQAQEATVSHAAAIGLGGAPAQRLIPDGIRPGAKEVSPVQSSGLDRDVS